MKLDIYPNMCFATSMPILGKSTISSNICKSVLDGSHDSSILDFIVSVVTGRQLPTVDSRLSEDM